MTRSLLFVGDVSWDITLEGARVPESDEKVIVPRLEEHVGGVIANAAVAAARAGASTRGLFRFGSDWRGHAASKALAETGVALSTATVPGSTALALIALADDGEKRLWLYFGQSMYPHLSQVDSCELGDCSWVHTAIYDATAAAHLVNRCRQAHIPWSIDLEPATFSDGVGGLSDHLRGAAIVFCNDAARNQLGPDAIDQLMALGAQRVVRTRGALGAEFYDLTQGTSAVIIPPPKLAAIDTTGAGDCLAGWFVNGLAAGEDPRTALERAVTAASLSCTKFGGQTSFPTAGELESYLGVSAGARLPSDSRR
jgi:ribokinase